VIHCSNCAATSGEDDVTCTVGPDGEEVCEAAYSSDDSSSDDDGSEEDDDDDEDEGKKWWLELSDKYCDNNLSKCSKLRKQGECESNPGFMKYACPLECDMCDEFTSSMKKKKRGIQPCMDHNLKCKEWAGMGECEHNPNYMLHACSRSCMQCYEDTTQFGVEQSLPDKDSKDYEATVEMIHNTAKYMMEMWSNEEHNNYNYKCKNMHEDCCFWAATGDECEDNQEFMKKECPAACQYCHLLDIRLRCPEVPGNDPVYKPGDLNRLFENIVDNADGKGEYTKYNPKALSRPKLNRDGTAANMNDVVDGPWIVLLENFVSDVEADALIAAGAKKGYERSSDVGAENPDGTHEDEGEYNYHVFLDKRKRGPCLTFILISSAVNDGRTSENAWCDEELCHDDPIINPVIERIAEVTHTHIDNHEELQLLRYEPGQFYNQHHDYIEYQQQLPCGVRMLTVFLYLNDVDDGGGTSFPFLDITVQPKKGYALVWPSVLDEDPEKKDRRTEHEALPVLKGIKYGKQVDEGVMYCVDLILYLALTCIFGDYFVHSGANAWIHSRNYTAAEENDCT